ncbi:MAG: MFS transporter [Anaerolineales bacterium]|nr:MFS transporter [Anaerolineales bacterium]
MADTAASAAARPETPARHRLAVGTKLAFGAGDTGPAILGAINGFFLLDFLVNVARLPPSGLFSAATVFLLVKLWDGVNDPIMGWLSDKTRSRMGRRRPWLLFGALPLGLAFFLDWIVPPLGETGRFFYYLVIALILDTALTAVLVPYTALTAELTSDYHERTSVNSFRFSFSILGSVVALFVHTQIIAALADNPYLGYAVSAGIWTVAIIVPCFIVFFGTKDHDHPLTAADTGGPGFIEGFQIAFRNRAFLLVALIYMCSWLTIQLVQSNLIFFVRDWVHMDVGLFGYVLIALQLSAFVCLLVWTRISARIGKKAVYYLGGTIFVLVELGLFLVRPGQGALVFALALIAGAGLSVAYLIPWSMLPDVIELDELETGRRREGIFYGVFVFLQKLGLAVGMFLSGQVLGLNGYIRAVPGQPPPIQPESALTAIRVLVGPVGAAILLFSFVAVYLYPITQARHQAIQAQLAARRATG